MSFAQLHGIECRFRFLRMCCDYATVCPLYRGILVLFTIYCSIKQILCIEDDIACNCCDYMVIILVTLQVVKNHASWYMDFGLIFVCSGPMVGIQE